MVLCIKFACSARNQSKSAWFIPTVNWLLLRVLLSGGNNLVNRFRNFQIEVLLTKAFASRWRALNIKWVGPLKTMVCSAFLCTYNTYVYICKQMKWHWNAEAYVQIEQNILWLFMVIWIFNPSLPFSFFCKKIYMRKTCK